ncbi:MAG: DNA primase DnaG [Candidatus Anstonellales archaeon]
MAKTYIDTVKYTIYAHFSVSGSVDKPDVVGAIFGQTEGLLGEDLDLRELQKNGRIGRIEVEIANEGGKTKGVIKIPSSLDMVETAIIGAALETVDRVGPYDASINVSRVEDNRNEKRKKIIDKAKYLLKQLIETQIPESRELTEMVKKEVKVSGLVEYGPERLPAGPSVDIEDKIIIVEGRADVINLLKNDISNVIAIGGAKVPKTIIELSKKKEITAFLDGDRGGDIILREMLNAGVDIDFIARAPPGMEVEELTRKEIIKILRNKEPVIHEKKREKPLEQEGNGANENERHVKAYAPREERIVNKEYEQRDENEIISKLKNELEGIKGRLRARLYDENFEPIKEISVREMLQNIISMNNIRAVVFDGVITQRLIDVASEKGIKFIVGIRKGTLAKEPENVRIII